MGISSAQMIGGNKRGKRHARDHYATPQEVTRSLIYEHEELFRMHDVVWEPACGSGAMAAVLSELFSKVVVSDIYDYGFNAVVDFLATDHLLAPVIITNPPYSLADAFIRHALELKPDILCLLLKSTFWHAKKRYHLFDAYTPWLVQPLIWRPDFDGRGAPTMDFIWVTWLKQYQGRCFYEPLWKWEGKCVEN